MRVLRNRAAVLAAIALTWHVMAMAGASAVLWLHHVPAEQAGMENCPLHSKPACPLHGEKHGTHECDCPTIGCSQTDMGMMALFGMIGILPPAAEIPATPAAGDAVPSVATNLTRLAPVPVSPPPRT